MSVPFYMHSLNEDDKAAVLEALSSPFLTRGKWVHDVEDRLARYTGNEFAVGLTSCTHALELALRLFGVGPGDEVITTPMTFAATSNAILHTGATPVFVDVEPTTGNMDVERARAAVTAKTRAILPIHLYGLMCDMVSLRALADEHNLRLIEDAAHCVEGSRDAHRPGNLGDAACFSFYATKNLTSGEGGAITVHDADHKARLDCISLHGMNKPAEKRFEGRYVHWDIEELGYKFNMSNIQAALLYHQFDRLDDGLARREAISQRYEQAFAPLEGIGFPAVPEGAKSARHLFPIWVWGGRRDEAIGHLQDRGIGVTVNYRAVHLLRFYRERFGFSPGAFEVAERLGDATLSLPLYPGLTDAQVDEVIDAVRSFVEG